MRRTPLSLAAATALVVTMAVGSSVLAQDQATEEHPVVGA